MSQLTFELTTLRMTFIEAAFWFYLSKSSVHRMYADLICLVQIKHGGRLNTEVPFIYGAFFSCFHVEYLPDSDVFLQGVRASIARVLTSTSQGHAVGSFCPYILEGAEKLNPVSVRCNPGKTEENTLSSCFPVFGKINMQRK